MLNSIIIILNKYLVQEIAQKTRFDLPSCSYLLDLGAKMIKYCIEGFIN